jgi:S-adenosylmethionine-diacylglycerol 3-amino-3-carboxypropyl transferase
VDPSPAPRLQFAVVREDPRIEADLVAEFASRRVLLIASGGCTALHLRARFPDLDLTLVDANRAQLAHVQSKLDALADGARGPDADPAGWNIGADDPEGLHERGNFERLFRLFRAALDLFVMAPSERRRLLTDAAATAAPLTEAAYWPAAFAAAFSDELLQAMFGPAATQHAPPGSYPAYFRRRIEAGLAAADRAANPWLHHVLLGHHLSDRAAWPPFLQQPPRDLRPFATIAGTLADVPSFAPYDLVGLSNVLDWTDAAGCYALGRRLAAELRPGAAVLWRQLNDPRPLAEVFLPEIVCDPERDARLTQRERSLFYDHVHFGIRQ